MTLRPNLKYVILDAHIIIEKVLHFCSSNIKLSGKNIIFDDKKVKKSDFYENKRLFKIDEIDVDKILVSKKEPYGTNKSIKYFIGYNDNDFIRPLCLKLPRIIGYAKCFDSNKTISFKVTDKKRLKNYIKIWGKVRNLMDIKFDSEPVYGDNDKCIKTKVRIHRDKVNTNFQGKKVPKENASYKCLSLIMLDSVIKANKKYCPQKLVEECKQETKKTEMENVINDELEPTPSVDETDSETKSDNESDNE